MSYSSDVIANYFLKKASVEARALTPMQLLKLVYIAHGYHLAFYDQPLVSERVQAWRYGPVIKGLYDKVRHYGSLGISELIPTGIFPWERSADVSPNVAALLDRVWHVYRDFSGLQLSSMTHQNGSPWDIAWNRDGGSSMYFAPIDDGLIRDHYKQIVQTSTEQAAQSHTFQPA